MSDMGEMFSAWDAMKKEKRAKNRQTSAQLLDHYKVQYESKNLGAHLIVKHGLVTIDFWPGTGLWLVRHRRKKGRGVWRLLNELGIPTV